MAIASLLAVTLALGADAEADTIQQIEQIEVAIGRAVVARDVDFVKRVWDDNFAYTGVRGERKNKAEIVAEIGAGKLQFDLLKFEDVQVKLHGQTAVVTGLAITKGTSPQGPITGQVRYTRVYVQKEGEWRLVAFQGTAESPKPESPDPK